jgi:hypothetical protein
MVKDIKIPIEEMGLHDINEAVGFIVKMKEYGNSLKVESDGERTFVISKENMDFSIFNSGVNEKISSLQKEMEAIKRSTTEVVEVAKNLVPILELIKGKQTEEKKTQELSVSQETIKPQEQTQTTQEEKYVEPTQIEVKSQPLRVEAQSTVRIPVQEQTELERITENTDAENAQQRAITATRPIEYKCKECGEISKFDVPLGVKAKQVTCKNCGKTIYYNENLKAKKSRAKQYVLFAALCIFAVGVLVSKYVAHLF